MNRIVVIGAGGHGRVVADIARGCGYKTVVFLDDAETSIASGNISNYADYKHDSAFVVAIGNNSIREKIQNILLENQCEIVSLIHQNAVIGSDVSIGIGSVVMAGAVINSGAQVGKGVIINTSCSIDHDCIIKDFSHVSVGAHLAGTVCVGEKTMVGAGAIVINNINICANSIIGAGAVVVKDITTNGTYVGVPARWLK